MKRYIAFLFAAIALLIALPCYAWEPPDAPHDSLVLDQAGKLSQDELDKLNTKLKQLAASTKNEYAVLIIPSLEGESIDDVAFTTFNKWHVGKKGLDNGVLIIIASGDRKDRIETGKGVEGDLPDLLTKDILEHHLKPHLKKNEYYLGLNETIDAINSAVENHGKDVTQKPSNSSSTTHDMSFGDIMIIIIIVGLGLLLLYWLLKKGGGSSGGGGGSWSSGSSSSFFDFSSGGDSGGGSFDFGGGSSGGGGADSSW